MIDKNRIKNLIWGLQELYDGHRLKDNDEDTIHNTLIFLGDLIGLKEEEVINW